jgi:Na+/H+ antiporter NhaA
VGDFVLSTDLHHFVNDALMTLFFFVVGLEVKREFTLGELTDRSRAIVPVVAAVAGLIVPALIFVAIAWPSGEASAWGIVISMDTAFLLGALAIIGPKFPARLRAFLLTLAVVDDIGALLVIAVFYNTGFDPAPLAIAVVLMVAIALVRFLRAGRGIAYAVLGIALWFAVLAAGIHPTLAGVAVALLIPVFPPARSDVERTAELTQAFRESPTAAYAAAVNRSLRESISINDRLQGAWGPYISFLVLPIFALANAGVGLGGASFDGDAAYVFWGTALGLAVGKPLGIFVVSRVSIRAGVAICPRDVSRAGLGVVGVVAGIGFTMSLFIAQLAFPPGPLLETAKLGILVGSLVAAVVGLGVGRALLRSDPRTAATETEAERSAHL